MTAPKIIVVNDEEAPRNIAGKILRPAGYNVILATNGLEGLLSIQAEKPDLVILDIVMPDIDGLEICTLIKSDPQLSNTYVLLLSGLKIGSENQAAGLAAGADDYITAPYSEQELLIRVRNLLQLKASRQAMKESLARQEVVSTLGRMALTDAELDGLFQFTIEELARTTRADRVGIFTIDPDANLLTYQVGIGWNPAPATVSMQDHLLLQQSLHTFSPLTIPQISSSERAALPLFLQDDVIKSVAAVPIQLDREPYGILLLVGQERDSLGDDLNSILQAIAHILGRSLSHRRAQQALQQQEEKLREVISQAPDGFVLVNEAEKIIDWNVAQEKMTGILRQEVIGNAFIPIMKRVVTAVTNFDADLDLLFSDIQRTFANGEQPDARLGSLICTIQDRHHLSLKAHISISRIQLGKGHVYCVITRDMTAEYERELLLQQEQRLASLGRLGASIAHELNNYLAVITLYSDLIMSDEVSASSHDRLNTMHQESKKAAALISKLVDYSGVAFLQLQLINLGDYLETLLADLKGICPDDIDITLQIDGGPYFIKADPQSLKKMVSNICENGFEAMEQGGQLTISVQAANSPPQLLHEIARTAAIPWLSINIQDTGVGIPPEIMDKVFDPFFSTKPITQKKGMGLAQAYGIALQHEGAITVHSEPGQGTNFTIYLPSFK